MLTIFTGWYSDKLGAGDQTCCCKPILAVCNKCQFYVKRRTNGIWRCMKMGKKIKKKKQQSKTYTQQPLLQPWFNSYSSDL